MKKGTRLRIGEGIAAVGLAVMLAAAPLWGGDVKSRKAFEIEIGGRLDLTLAAFNDEMFETYTGARTHDAGTTQVVERLGVPLGSRLSPADPASTGGDVIFDPRLTLDMQIKLTEKVRGLVELRTPFYVFGDEGGTSRDSRLHGNRVRRYLDVSQIYAELNDVGLEGLTFRAGVQNYERDLRGDGNAFLIATNYAESPFDSLTGAPAGASGNLPETQEAAGIFARYDNEDYGAIDLFYFIIDETYELNHDDAIFGGIVEIYFDAERRTGKITPTFLVLQNDPESFIYTLGTGLQFLALDQHLELYGEIYGQWGTYDRHFHTPSAGDSLLPDQDFAGTEAATGLFSRLNGRRIKQSAWAGYAGFRYTLDLPGLLEDVKPYIDASYWEVSGDDDASDSFNKNFVSLENNNRSLIVENAYYGLDIDSNYRAVRVILGFWPHPKVRLEGSYAYFELQRNNGLADVTRGDHDKIGDEVDVKLVWTYTDYLRVIVGTGWLFDAKAIGPEQDINLSMLQVQLDF